jgi:hypothetical protein
MTDSKEIAKEITDEEAAAYFKEIVKPAIVKFQVGLRQALKGPEREGAAIAIVAALTFINNMKWDMSCMVPLEWALDIVEKGIAPQSYPYYRRAETAVRNIDAVIGKPLPPIDENEKYISRECVNRIIAVIAIDYQILSKVPLAKALTNVVGHDPVAAESLKNFRENLRRAKRGLQRDAYDDLGKSFKDMPPGQAAFSALLVYKQQIGSADAEREVTRLATEMLKPQKP